MSTNNIELVRSIFAAWECGDFSSAEWADPQIEFVIADGPAPGNWTGLLGLAEGFRGFVSAWQGYGVAADEYVELDSERVLVWLHPTGRGRTSGIDLKETRTKAANLFHVRSGKINKLVLYLDSGHAVADLGPGAETSPP